MQGADGLSRRCQALMKNCRNFRAYWVGETLVWERKSLKVIQGSCDKNQCLCTKTLKCSPVLLLHITIQKLRHIYEIISHHWHLSQGGWGKITVPWLLNNDICKIHTGKRILQSLLFLTCFSVNACTPIEKENIYLKRNTLEALIFLSCLIMN